MNPHISEHDRSLAAAFDGQAAQFERAPVQSNPEALRRLVTFADLPEGSRVLDAGCGPGLVAEAFLEAGYEVVGVDLSAEMITRAERRNDRFGSRAVFRQGSVFEDHPDWSGPFDAVVSRYVLHHVDDPLGFLRRQFALLRPGGFLILSDHTTDPDPERAQWHQQIEKARDRTHTTNLSPGGLIDHLAQAGLVALRLVEEPFTLDFDEWFDRGTPDLPKEELRDRLRQGPQARGFQVRERADGGLTIACWQALVSARKPDGVTLVDQSPNFAPEVWEGLTLPKTRSGGQDDQP